MNAQEFIQHQCKLLADSFPVEMIRYKYDALSETHFIQVLPEELYNNDVAYEAFEESLIDAFYENFPDEGICVFSENSIESLQDMPVLFERISPIQAIPAVFEHSFIVSASKINALTSINFEVNELVSNQIIPNICNKPVGRHFSSSIDIIDDSNGAFLDYNSFNYPNLAKEIEETNYSNTNLAA